MVLLIPLRTSLCRVCNTSVAPVVVCVLGLYRNVMAWDFDIGEVSAGAIVPGYSVDYVVHLAHIY
eukprot:2847952-Amphidinium_carterae.1